MPRWFTFVGLLCCSDPSPAPCARLCWTAATLQEECLEEEGLSWSQTVWGTRGAFDESCAVWTETQLRLTRRELGHRCARDRVANGCAQLVSGLEATPTCEAYLDINWDTLIAHP